MFGLYNIPRTNYGYYYQPRIYRRRYFPIEYTLLKAMREAEEYDRLKNIIYQKIEEEYEQSNHKEKEEINKENKEEHKEEYKEENKEEHKEENKEDKEDKEVKKEGKVSPFYYFESKRRFDGQQICEEIREKTIDSEGQIHQKLKRRLGDQWYETEGIEYECGKKSYKETWHNVSEEEVEQFKHEWISKIGYEDKTETSETPITQDEQEEQEERKSEKEIENKEGKEEQEERQEEIIKQNPNEQEIFTESEIKTE